MTSFTPDSLFANEARPLTRGDRFIKAGSGALKRGQVLRLDGAKLVPWIVGSAAVPAVKAAGTITFAANPTDADTVTIGAQVFRFKGTMAAINDIKLGGTLEATLASLAKAINGTGVAGTDYFLGTVTPHAKVSAAVNAGNTVVTITALEAGTSGNSVALASSAVNAVVSGAVLSGGAAEVASTQYAPESILAQDTDASGDDDVSAAEYLSGQYNPAALTPVVDITSTAVVNRFRAVGIFFRPVQES